MKKILLYFLFSNILLHPYDYDLVIIGAGAAGTAAALYADTFKNKKIALVESKDIATQITPSNGVQTRTLVHAANIIHYIKHAHNYGITLTEAPNFNYHKLFKHIHNVTQSIHNNIKHKLRKTSINIVTGSAQFADEHTIIVNKQIITSNHFIIATGSIARIPNIAGIKNVPYLTPETFFKKEQIPKSIIIIGGGSLGTEMAFCLNRLGTNVTLIMKHALLLPTFDYELAQKLKHKLKAEGAHIYCGMQTKSITTTNNTIKLACADWQNKIHTFTADALFIATNRKPNIATLQLKHCNVEHSDRGIHVDTTMQTTAPHIYACGDVIGSYLSVRSACYEAQIATYNALKDPSKVLRQINHKNFTQILYTSPSYATIGFTEQDAYALYGDTINVHKYDYHNLDKAHIECTTEGHAKFICDAKNNLIGAHILGAHAEELIGFIEIGKPLNKFCIHHLQEAHPYPSYMDIFWDAATPYIPPNEIETIGIINTIKQQYNNWIRTLFSYFKK